MEETTTQEDTDNQATAPMATTTTIPTNGIMAITVDPTTDTEIDKQKMQPIAVPA